MKFYPYHSGALSENLYNDAVNEIIKKINNFCKLQKSVSRNTKSLVKIKLQKKPRS